MGDPLPTSQHASIGHSVSAGIFGPHFYVYSILPLRLHYVRECKPKTGILRNGVFAKKMPLQLKSHLFGPQLPFGLFLDTWDRILKESMDSEKVPYSWKVDFWAEKVPFHHPYFLLGFGLKRPYTVTRPVSSSVSLTGWHNTKHSG